MMSCDNLSCREIFVKSLESLSPTKLLENTIVFDSATKILHVSDNEHQYDLKNGYYLIGFGKAVLGLASQVLTSLEGVKVKGNTSRE